MRLDLVCKCFCIRYCNHSRHYGQNVTLTWAKHNCSCCNLLSAPHISASHIHVIRTSKTQAFPREEKTRAHIICTHTHTHTHLQASMFEHANSCKHPHMHSRMFVCFKHTHPYLPPMNTNGKVRTRTHRLQQSFHVQDWLQSRSLLPSHPQPC
jgi:hypothetical protein